MKVTTKSGFKFEIDERVIEDYRMIEALKKADNTDDPGEMLNGTVEVVNLVFGADKARLMEHIKGLNDGFVPTSAMREELDSVFARVKALKNSGSSRG